MDPHKEIMDNFLKSLTNARTSSVLSDDKYEAVLKHLKDPNTKVDRNFKHWVHKNKGFQLVDLGLCKCNFKDIFMYKFIYLNLSIYIFICIL